MKKRLLAFSLCVTLCFGLCSGLVVTVSAADISNLPTISGGVLTGYAIKADGTLWGWGQNNDLLARFSDGDRNKSIMRTEPIKLLEGVKSVVGTWFPMSPLVLKQDNSIWRFTGYYLSGIWKAEWYKVIDNVKYAGDGCAVLYDNSLWTWDNLYSNAITDNKPVKLMDGVKIAHKTGSMFFVVKLDGSLWGMGSNIWGALGDGSTEEKTEFTKIMDNVKDVKTFGLYTMIIKEDGSLWSCGRNFEGVLGDGTKTDIITGNTIYGPDNNKHTPVKIMDNVRTVYLSSETAFAIKDDNSLWGWGRAREGQLGLPTSPWNQLLPQRIMGDVADVAASSESRTTFILKTDGSLWACGNPSFSHISPSQYLTWEFVTPPIKIMDGVMLPGNISSTPTPPQPPADAPSTWAKPEVDAAIAAGLVPEHLQKNYQTEVTRGEVAQMFINLIEKASGQTIDAFMTAKGVSISNNAFTDTNDRAVLAANALGIIKGVGNNRFDPYGVFTRGQIAVIINRVARVLGVNTDGYTHSFTDITENWIDIELGWPVFAEIIQGVGGNRFDPDASLTIEMAILATYRALAPLKQ